MGRHISAVFGRKNLNFRVLAVRMNFRCAPFLLLVFALAITFGALSVHLLSLVSVLFFGYLYNFLVILFSVCGWHRIV